MKNEIEIDIEQIDIRLFKFEGGYKGLKEFPIEQIPKAINIEDGEKIEMLKDGFSIARQAIEDILTIDEVYVVTSAFNGIMYDSQINDKDFLLFNVEDGILYEELDDKFNVDKDELLLKLKNLSEFQTLCVIRQVYEFLNLRVSCDEDIKRIFAIK